MNSAAKQPHSPSVSFEEYAERFRLFDAVPTATAMFKVEQDKEGNPSDFVPIYANRACHELFHAVFPMPIGRSFYQTHPTASRKLLKHCSRTALDGKPQKIEHYIPELRKYLQVSCYQALPGVCGCVFQDLTRQRKIERRASRSQHKLNVIIQHSIDYLFDFDLKTMMLADTSNMLGRPTCLPQIGSLPYGLVKLGLMQESSVPAALAMVDKIKKGANVASCTIEFRSSVHTEFQWYSIALHACHSTDAPATSVIGYLKNINGIILRQKRLESLANKDSLTRIHNLRAGRALVEEQLSPSQPPRQNTMFLFDMDNFKNINDLYGHYTGDEVLQKFATLLISVFRQTDIVYRMGGDEFIAFAPNAGGDYFLHRICHDILDMTSHLPSIDFPISVSIGVAVGSTPGATYEDYYKQADKALYSIKNRDKAAYAFSYF